MILDLFAPIPLAGIQWLDQFIIELDLLIGSDYFWKVVNPYKLPVERAGMWLTPDRFGRYFISGRIPGSSKKRQQQSVHYVSIHHINVEHPNLKDKVEAKSNQFEVKEFKLVNVNSRVCKAKISQNAINVP